MKTSTQKKANDAEAEKADKKARAKPTQGAMEDKETCGDYVIPLPLPPRSSDLYLIMAFAIHALFGILDQFFPPPHPPQLLMDIIGRGAFGVVFRAVHRHRGNWVAIKNVRLNKKKKSQLNSLMVRAPSFRCAVFSPSLTLPSVLSPCRWKSIF
jgi:serine/threonine protein kinase